MRFALAVLSSIVFAAMLLFAPAEQAAGDDTSQPSSLPQDPRKEWYEISKGRTDFEISDPALVPGRLAVAAKQSGCDYASEMKSVPMRFMRLGGRRLAFVFCNVGLASLSHRVFDLTNLVKLAAVEFPILAHPKGFGTTATPGLITQEKETGLFFAVSGSDFDPRRIRHTYRFDIDWGVVIVRVEFQQNLTSEWITVWDAPVWSLPAAPK